MTTTAAPFASKTERETHYRAQLASSPKWALRALAILYSLQTADEQRAGAASSLNGVGFSGRDSEILSSFARQVEAWNAETAHKYPAPLSPKQMVFIFRMMPRYAVQLIEYLETTGAIPTIAGRSTIVPRVTSEEAADLPRQPVLNVARRVPQLPPISSADVGAAAARVEARIAADESAARASETRPRMPSAPIDLVALASRIQA